MFCGVDDFSLDACNADVDSGTLLSLGLNSHQLYQETPEGIKQGVSSLDMTFLQGRGQLLARGELGEIDPRIRDGEMSTVRFITNYSRYAKAGVNLRKWLVTSVDTDQWMLVLLAMGTGYIPIDGPSRVDVTVARHVKSKTEYVYINRPL